MKKINKILNIVLIASTILVLVCLWFVGAIVVDESLILPSPVEVVSKAFILFGEGDFWVAFLDTLGRSVVSFLISITLALALALIIHFYAKSGVIIQTLISILRVVPTIAVILILLLWTNSKVASMVVTILVILPTSFSMIRMMLGKIDNNVINMCKVYGVNKKNILFKYVFPLTLPNFFEIMGNALSLNIKLIVASEVLAGTAKSIGNMMSESKIYFETSRLFALVLIMMVVALFIEMIFNLISERKRKKYAID